MLYDAPIKDTAANQMAVDETITYETATEYSTHGKATLKYSRTSSGCMGANELREWKTVAEDTTGKKR